MPRCTSCQSFYGRKFTAEIGIHFPGREGLEKPLVLASPTLIACLNCGHVEFVLAAGQVEQLRNGVFPAQCGRVHRDCDRS
jgi:hypothetical protein